MRYKTAFLTPKRDDKHPHLFFYMGVPPWALCPCILSVKFDFESME